MKCCFYYPSWILCTGADLLNLSSSWTKAGPGKHLLRNWVKKEKNFGKQNVSEDRIDTATEQITASRTGVSLHRLSLVLKPAELLAEAHKILERLVLELKEEPLGYYFRPSMGPLKPNKQPCST